MPSTSLDDADGLGDGLDEAGGRSTSGRASYDRAALAAGRAVQHARRSGDEHPLAEALLQLIASQCFGSATPGRSASPRSTSSPRTSLDPANWRHPHSPSAACAIGRQGAFDQARSLTALGIEIAEALGMPIEGCVFTCSSAATWKSEAGDLDRRRTRLPAELRDRRRDRFGGVQDDSRGEPGSDALRSRTYRRGRGLRRDRCETSPPRTISGRRSSSRSVRSLVLAARGEFDEAERLGRRRSGDVRGRRGSGRPGDDQDRPSPRAPDGRQDR